MICNSSENFGFKEIKETVMNLKNNYTLTKYTLIKYNVKQGVKLYGNK